MISDSIRDNGLAYATTHGSAIYICSQDPTTYAEATSTYALGNKTGITVGSPTDGASNGRRVIVPAVTDGTVTGTDTATHWALVKTTSTTELLATGEIDPTQAVTDGNVWTMGARSITIPD